MAEDSNESDSFKSVDRAWQEEVKKDLLASIKRNEREKSLVFIIFLSLLTAFTWYYGDEFSTVVKGIIALFVVIGAIIICELLNVKIMLLKAELREVMQRQQK